MRHNTTALIYAMASMIGAGCTAGLDADASVLNLRPPADTTEAARLGEFGPDVPAMNRKTDRRKRRARMARKQRRGWA